MKQKVAFWLKTDQLARLRAIQKEIGVPVSESLSAAQKEEVERSKRDAPVLITPTRPLPNDL